MRCRPECLACERIERHYPSDEVPSDIAPCKRIDRDLLEYLESRPGPTISFTRALEIQKQIEHNATSVDALVAHIPLPADATRSLQYLFAIHDRLFYDTEIEYGGRLRNSRESVYFGAGGRREGLPGDTLAGALTVLFEQTICGDLKALSRDRLSIAAAQLLYTILAIHPFVDGNGRAARYLFKALVHSTSRFVPLAFQTRDNEEAERRYLVAIQEVDLAMDHDVRFAGGPSSYAPLANYLQTHIAERNDEEEPEDFE
jgi:fido (protein-threonine AMPylation protein)